MADRKRFHELHGIPPTSDLSLESIATLAHMPSEALYNVYFRAKGDGSEKAAKNRVYSFAFKNKKYYMGVDDDIRQGFNLSPVFGKPRDETPDQPKKIDTSVILFFSDGADKIDSTVSPFPDDQDSLSDVAISEPISKMSRVVYTVDSARDEITKMLTRDQQPTGALCARILSDIGKPFWNKPVKQTREKLLKELYGDGPVPTFAPIKRQPPGTYSDPKDEHGVLLPIERWTKEQIAARFPLEQHELLLPAESLAPAPAAAAAAPEPAPAPTNVLVEGYDSSERSDRMDDIADELLLIRTEVEATRRYADAMADTINAAMREMLRVNIELIDEVKALRAELAARPAPRPRAKPAEEAEAAPAPPKPNPHEKIPVAHESTKGLTLDKLLNDGDIVQFDIKQSDNTYATFKCTIQGDVIVLPSEISESKRYCSSPSTALKILKGLLVKQGKREASGSKTEDGWRAGYVMRDGKKVRLISIPFKA